MAGPHDDLHALLDDALEGFDRGAAPRGTADQQPSRPPPAAAAAVAAPQPAAQQQQGVGGPPPRLVFDPLARRSAAARRDAAAAGGPPGAAASVPGEPPGAGELDVLSKGLSKLLEELASADEQGEGPASEPELAAAPGASEQPPAGRQQQQQEQQREEQQREQLHATLRALSEQAPSFAGEGGSEDEMLRLLAEHLGALGDEEGTSGGGSSAGGGAGAAPGMASLVDTIMQQLLSKEVLYQPMKDIGDRYPEWLETNKDKLSPEDLERYQQQLVYIRRICELYETTPSNYAQLVDLLQQMQQCGQPPQEIVDELAPGMQFGPDGLPSFAGDEQLPAELRNCVIQ